MMWAALYIAMYLSLTLEGREGHAEGEPRALQNSIR
jgi:hypothetical protein